MIKATVCWKLCGLRAVTECPQTGHKDRPFDFIKHPQS
jgi:hypothetical protein